MLSQCDGAPASQHGGNSSTAVSAAGNRIVCNKLESRAPVHIAGATKETKRFNPSGGIWSEVYIYIYIYIYIIHDVIIMIII